MSAPGKRARTLQEALARWAMLAASPEALELALGLILLVIIGLGLFGCQTLPEKPIVQTVTVEKPVPVSCKVPAIERPAWETERANAADPVLVSRAIRAELEQRRGYEEKIEAAARSCE